MGNVGRAGGGTLGRVIVATLRSSRSSRVVIPDEVRSCRVEVRTVTLADRWW